MTPESTILELAESGLFKDAAQAIDQRSIPSPALKAIRVQLEAHIGNPLTARERAEALLKERLTNRDKAIVHDVLGRVNLSIGRTDQGVQALRRAVDFAHASDVQLEARLVASFAEALLHWVGIEPAAIEAPRLRRLAFRSGDAYSMISWHSLVAEIHAKRGLLAAGSSSISTGRSLLAGFPNVWQQGRLAITAAGIALIYGDYEEAMAQTREALDCAERSGSRELRIPALGNLAHINLAREQINESTAALRDLLGVVRKGGSTEIGVRDTQMQVAMAAGDLDLASSLSKEILLLSEDLQNGSSYYGLWHLLTRVKWLYRTGDAHAGVTLAMDAIPRIERMADRNLLERMKLLAAEGLGRIGKANEGVNLMAEAVNANPDPPLEMMAEASRVAGRLAAHDDRSAAIAHFERAGRILQSVGNLTARADIQRDAVETIAGLSMPAALPAIVGDQTAVVREDISQMRSVDARPPSASLAERIAALVDFAGHPPLLATEVLSLIADTDTVDHATIAEVYGDGTRELLTTFSSRDAPATVDDHPEAVRITLGMHRERVFEITAIPRPSPAARATLLAVERLVQTAQTLCKARHFEREQAALWPEHTAEQQLGLVCSSERMIDLVKSIRRVAGSNMTVLLTGETGVGKELLARALHQASHRHERVFLPFNCTTVSRDMLVSQLFGYRKGAFTGANDEFPGLIRSAAGGTLFLDEIGEMSPEVQPKLLRFLESGEILPLGESRPQLVDVRVVAATNANLDQLVSEGKFREDLYYRLNVIPLRVPPLRERREEIPALVDHFLERYSRESQKPLLRVAEETLEYLVLYRWPGNVRQLSNEIRRLVVLAEPGAVLMPEHLSADIAASRRTIATGDRALEPSEVLMRTDQPLSAAIEHLERALIQRALKQCDGRVEDAAKMLGLSRKGLYLKRVRLGMD